MFSPTFKFSLHCKDIGLTLFKAIGEFEMLANIATLTYSVLPVSQLL